MKIKKKQKKMPTNLLKKAANSLVSKILPYQKIHATKFALAAGISGAILVFLTTLTAVFGISQAATFFFVSIYGTFGYTVSWLGAFLGALYGFIDSFIFVWIAIVIYNKLIS